MRPATLLLLAFPVLSGPLPSPLAEPPTPTTAVVAFQQIWSACDSMADTFTAIETLVPDAGARQLEFSLALYWTGIVEAYADLTPSERWVVGRRLAPWDTAHATVALDETVRAMDAELSLVPRAVRLRSAALLCSEFRDDLRARGVDDALIERVVRRMLAPSRTLTPPVSRRRSLSIARRASPRSGR